MSRKRMSKATAKSAAAPAAKPTVQPAAKPTVQPTVKPAAKPAAEPTVKPAAKPAATPKPAAPAPAQTPEATPTTRAEYVKRVEAKFSETGKPVSLSQVTDSKTTWSRLLGAEAAERLKSEGKIRTGPGGARGGSAGAPRSTKDDVMLLLGHLSDEALQQALSSLPADAAERLKAARAVAQERSALDSWQAQVRIALGAYAPKPPENIAGFRATYDRDRGEWRVTVIR